MILTDEEKNELNQFATSFSKFGTSSFNNHYKTSIKISKQEHKEVCDWFAGILTQLTDHLGVRHARKLEAQKAKDSRTAATPISR